MKQLMSARVARTVLAVDIGAESGRVIAARFDGQRLALEECYRFANVPVRVKDTLHWDVLRLWHDVQAGIRQAGKADAIGIDTWAIDFGLLDQAGNLIGNPVHYRDRRTEGMPEAVFARVPRAEVFRQTGVQILPFNTLYQLVSLVQRHDPSLESAQRLLTIPDLFYYWLTGVPVNEFTNATTTQCFNTLSGDWAFDLLETLGIPTRLFSPVSHPGQILGKNDGVPVVLAPHHDTACAVVGVPVQNPDFAYLSSGTWSLLGLELERPIINDQALALNVTNEGGYGKTSRLLKNIMGLWLLQESRRTWLAQRQEYSYDRLAMLAQQSPALAALIDPDDATFLPPGDMPSRINAFCRKTGQPEPQNVGAVARCIFESLALKYRAVLRQLVDLTGRRVDTLHIVGGGALNALLCQMAADATGCSVIAGPVEATALGNAVVQLITLGELGSIAQGRALIADSFASTTYAPHDTARWDEVDARFQALLNPSA
jgi:rhamnulokinase